MGSISHHITPLVINSLGGGHTHTHTFADRSNSKKPGAPGLKIIDFNMVWIRSCTIINKDVMYVCNYNRVIRQLAMQS